MNASLVDSELVDSEGVLPLPDIYARTVWRCGVSCRLYALRILIPGEAADDPAWAIGGWLWDWMLLWLTQ